MFADSALADAGPFGGTFRGWADFPGGSGVPSVGCRPPRAPGATDRSEMRMSRFSTEGR